MCIKHLAIAVVAASVGIAGSGQVYAQVYKKVLPDGSVVFTDEPTEGAQTINVQPLPTISLPGGKAKTEPTANAKGGKATDEAKSATQFSTFAITEPAHDSAVRSNNGAVTINLNIQPGLDPKQGHAVTLLLDGKPTGAPGAQTSFTIEGVERGSHTIGAEIRDGSGRVVASANPVLFHLLRHSAQH